MKTLFEYLLVFVGASGLTLLFFFVLPLMQTLAKPPERDVLVFDADIAELEAPEETPEIEEEAPPEQEEAPPELGDEPQPLANLDMLNIALNPGTGGGPIGGDFAININAITATSVEETDALFSVADLDQKPRPIYQPGPILNDKLKKAGGGTVKIIFVVDQRGRVQNPKVQSSPNPIYNAPALKAIKQWKFEPGKRNGQPVRFRMRVPITFPKAG